MHGGESQRAQLASGRECQRKFDWRSPLIKAAIRVYPTRGWTGPLGLPSFFPSHAKRAYDNLRGILNDNKRAPGLQRTSMAIGCAAPAVTKIDEHP